MRILNKEGRIRAVFLIPVALILLGISYYSMVSQQYLVTVASFLLGAACLLACLKDPRNRFHSRTSGKMHRTSGFPFFGLHASGYSSDGGDVGGGDGGGGGE